MEWDGPTPSKDVPPFDQHPSAPFETIDPGPRRRGDDGRSAGPPAAPLLLCAKENSKGVQTQTSYSAAAASDASSFVVATAIDSLSVDYACDSISASVVYSFVHIHPLIHPFVRLLAWLSLPSSPLAPVCRGTRFPTILFSLQHSHHCYACRVLCGARSLATTCILFLWGRRHFFLPSSLARTHTHASVLSPPHTKDETK